MAVQYFCASACSGSAPGSGARGPGPNDPDDPDDPLERFTFLLVRCPVGAILLDPNAAIIDCNPTALNLVGLTREQVVGRAWDDIGWDLVHEDGTRVSPEDGPVAEAIRGRRMIGGVIVERRRPRRGDRVWLELHVCPRVSRSGALREVIVLFRDVTEFRLRKLAERLRDRAEAERVEADRRREEAERRAAEAERQQGETSRRLQLAHLERALPGASPAVVRLRGEVQDAAQTLEDLPVLILGEPGTGKTLVARTLHDVSSRGPGPFEAVDCPSISPSLFESEIFGHEKGAFTGAVASLPGRFELAHGGTLFLDEVGEFPLEQQPKLLVALQERRVRRLGAKAPVDVDIAIIAATNRDLPRMVADGRFRADLYDRLNGVTISVPPLRDRRDDVEALVREVVRSTSDRRGTPPPAIDAQVLAALRQFDWPANIRQLQQVVQRMMGRARGGALTIELVPDEIRHATLSVARGAPAESLSRDALIAALAAHHGNVRRTAASLGVSRTRLYRLMEKHAIKPPR